MNKFILPITVFSLLNGFILSQVHGAGFEKSTLWSAEFAGKAGAAASSVSGADSLFFNPAGLARGEDGAAQVSANFSPSFSKSKGPITKSQEKLEGETTFSPISGLLGSYQVNPDLGLGLGFYTTGGGSAKFTNVDFSGVSAKYDTLKPTVENDMKLMEFGLGVGYKVNPEWSLGLTYRVSIARATFSMAQATSTFLAASTFKDLKDENFTGFRLGTQYRSEDKKWGFGLVYRNQVTIKAKGKSSGNQEWTTLFDTRNNQAMTGGGDATVKTYFPQELSLGTHYQFMDNSTLFFETNWHDYSQNKEVTVSGTPLYILASVDVLANNAANISQKWHDQYNFRLGYEYTGFESWIMRAGYLATTQVTDEDHALAIFIAPGVVHSLAFGGGTSFLNNQLTLDGAAEYAFVEGDGRTSLGYTGEFSGQTTSLHLSAKYNF